MPRIADVTLHERILEATYKLVRKKGLQAVTLRAVAAAAQTTTPTVYERFSTKDDLLLALADKLRRKIVAKIVSSSTMAEACEVYLDFAVENPHDYKLLFDVGWPRVFENLDDQPGQIWTMQQLAAHHGGHMESYRGAAEALWIHLHGAATFISAAPNSSLAKRFRTAALHDCEVMIQHAKLFQRNKKKD